MALPLQKRMVQKPLLMTRFEKKKVAGSLLSHLSYAEEEFPHFHPFTIPTVTSSANVTLSRMTTLGYSTTRLASEKFQKKQCQRFVRTNKQILSYLTRRQSENVVDSIRLYHRI
jgi:hypothetical protein